MASDAELLDAWRSGNPSAGETLFERYYAPVRRFFANKVRETPADLVQETFMACVTGRDRIREDGNFRSYLFGVAYRVLSAHLRRKYSAPADLGTITAADLDPGPSTIMHRSEEVRLLLQALRSLPIDLQVVVELRYWEQMNSTDISQVLGIPAATVRGRLRQGRLLLEETLRTLSATPELLESTVGDIDGWAQKIRERMQQVDA